MAGTALARNKHGLLYLIVNPASAGDNTLLAALAASVKIRVCQLVINCNAGANTILFESANTTAIFPQLEYGDLGGMVLPYNEDGWMETAANEALTCVLTNATAVGMHIGYKHSTY